MSSITNLETLLDTDEYVASYSNDALEDSIITSDENEHPNILGGRLKGSTAAKSLDQKKKIAAAMKDAASELKAIQASAKVTKERIRKGALTEIILSCKRKHGLNDDVSIAEGTIRQRLK
jgi:hypothetical protein